MEKLKLVSPPQIEIKKSSPDEKKSRTDEKKISVEKKPHLNLENNNNFLGDAVFFNNALINMKRRKSMMSLSQYNMDQNEENIFEEMDIRQEFDILKSYKLYFPHNNCEAVLENIRQNSMKEKQREIPIISQRSKRKKTKASVRVVDGERAERKGKRIAPKEIKEKSFLGNFLRKNHKAPTFNSLMKGFQ